MLKIKYFIITFLFIFLAASIFSQDEEINKNMDSITGATVNKKAPLKLKEEEKQVIQKEKKPVKKQETKKTTKQRDRFIEFVDEDTRIVESEIKNMMLFGFDKNVLLTDVYELNLSSEMTPWYKAKDFIPDSIDNFLKAEPVYTYSKDKIIKPGFIKLKSDLGEQIFSYAYGLYKNNETKKAEMIFEKLVNYNHRVLESYYYLSWCKYLLKDYFSAISYMKETVKKAEAENIEPPVIADYYYQLGSMYLKIDDYSNAVNYIKTALEKSPASYSYYNNLGIIYYKLGDFENAKASWKKGMEGKDANSSANYKILQDK